MMPGLDWTADDRAFTYHGGALEVARRLAPQAPEPWIDLSTGVSPHAYPLPDLEPEKCSRLPETGALAKLARCGSRLTCRLGLTLHTVTPIAANTAAVSIAVGG